MAEASEALQLATQVNLVLNDYISIHDKIFAPNMRHITPIPGFFEKIEFCKLETELKTLRGDLRGVRSSIPSARSTEQQHRAFLDTLDEFSKALGLTVSQLHNISHNLCAKSQSRMDYSWEKFNKDLKVYEASVQKYYDIGGRLNALLPTVRD